MKHLSKIIILFIVTFLAACGGKDEVKPSGNTTTDGLELNSWSVDGKVYKLSQYGFGWASTDFSPRAGWTFVSATEKSNLDISVLVKPVPAGTHTIENYALVHLNAGKTTVTGKKIGLRMDHNNAVYEGIAGGTAEVTIANGKTTYVFKDAVLKDILTNKTIKVSANVQYTN